MAAQGQRNLGQGPGSFCANKPNPLRKLAGTATSAGVVTGSTIAVDLMILVFGFLIASALALAGHFAQSTKKHKTELATVNHNLAAEADERILAETALRRNENRFRTLFENSQLSVWNVDMSQVLNELNQLKASGVKDLRQCLASNLQIVSGMAAKIRVKQVNHATLKLFGANSEDELLKNLDKILGPDAIEVLIDELCAIWEKKKGFQSELAYRNLQGKEIRVIVSMPIPATEEGFQSIPISITDITERKQAEHKLKQSESRYRSLVANVPMCIHEIDFAGKIISINQTGLDMLQADSKEDVVGQSYLASVSNKDRHRVYELLRLANSGTGHNLSS